ncbi:MAG: DNA polymerase III subunit beta [Acidiferrobacterales bacterium]|nr:DNA polymerase III subunit beta [Acidiferrobacterales bacterium]
MNIKIERSKLLPTLSLVSSVVERRQTLPILANLFFHLDSGRLTLVGTDLEVEISETLDSVDGEDGSFTVSSRKLLDISKMLPESSTINLKTDGEKAIMSSGRSRYTLKTLPSEEYPRIESGNWEERFKIKQLSLKNLLSKTAFAMAIQDVRYYLNGVLFEIGQNRLRAIATDGHRLAQSEEEIEISSNEIRQVIVPRKAITEISRFLDGDEESEITIEVSKNHLRLTRGDTTLITKLIDGKFPEFKGVLETELNVVIQADRSELIETLTRAAVLTTDRFKGVKLKLDQGKMSVTANNPEQEEALEEMEIDYKGDSVETGYNVTYLIDACRAITTDQVALHFQGNDGICIVRQPGDEISTWLVMPMRI